MPTEGRPTTLVCAFDLPGVQEDKINVELNDGTLTVSAQCEQTEEASGERFYRFERRFGSCARSVGLPQGVDEFSVKADYEDGVLEVRVASRASEAEAHPDRRQEAAHDRGHGDRGLRRPAGRPSRTL